MDDSLDCNCADDWTCHEHNKDKHFYFEVKRMPLINNGSAIFSCPPRCSAGGPDVTEGHVFDRPFETYWENGNIRMSGFRCKCGLTNIDYHMWRAPDIKESP